MAITTSKISALVGEPYFSRGQDYFHKGMIFITSMGDKEITGKALGTDVYTTSLHLERRSLDGRCSCPAFAEIGPCKHMAALGLAWQTEKKGGYEPSEEISDVISEYDEKKKVLRKASKAELIEAIIDISYNYPEILDQFEE